MTKWDGKANNKLVAEGLYYYQVKSTIDYEGKQPQIFKIPVLIDNTVPTVSKPRYDDGTKSIAFSAADPRSGSGIKYLTLSVNGRELEQHVAPTKDNNYRVKLTDYTYKDDKTPVNVNEGDDIKVTANDYAGNKGFQDFKASNDHTVPYIVSDTPEATGEYASLEIPVKGYVTDDSELAYMKVEYEGKTKDLALVWNEEKKRHDFDETLTFSKEGKQDIRFSSADKYGNEIDFNREIYIDITAPKIDVKYKEYTSSSSQKVTVTASDNYDALRLLVNGNEEINTFIDMGNVPVYKSFKKTKDITIPLENGANEVEFVLTDLVGHEVIKTITIHKVSGPKKPSINVVSDASKTITGKAASGSTVTITDNKKLKLTATASGGKYSIKLPNKLKAGTVLYATVTDKKTGLVSDKTKITVKDKTAPAAPTVKEVSDKTQTVTGKTEAGAKVTIKAGKTTLGTATAKSNGSYSIKMKKQKAGTSLSITAKDKAGNTSKAKKVTVKDKTAPSAPSINKVTINSTKVTGKAEAGAKVTVKAGKTTLGTATAKKNGSYSVKIKKQKADTSLSVTAKDKAGNTSKVKKTTVKKK